MDNARTSTLHHGKTDGLIRAHEKQKEREYEPSWHRASARQPTNLLRRINIDDKKHSNDKKSKFDPPMAVPGSHAGATERDLDDETTT